MLAIILVVLAAYAFYQYSVWTFDYWKKRKVPHPPPVPLFGNIKEVVLMKQYPGHCHQQIYKMYPNEKFVGLYQLRMPSLLIRDPSLVKQCLIKDFDHFFDRGFHTDEEREPLTGHLVSLTGTRWKLLRTKLTPVFSSGKIKQMFPLLLDCSDQLRDFIKTQMGGKEGVLEMREVTARFTTDVIGTVAFGLQFESMSGDSVFRQMGKRALQPTVAGALAKAMRCFTPKLFDLLKMRTFPEEINSFFTNVVSETMKQRTEANYGRNDFLQLMMQLRDASGADIAKNDIELNDQVIAAQAFVFFLAGFETSSTTLSYCLYELAKNRQCQEAVFNEIQEVMKKHGELSYEAVSDMIYLEQVLLETMRMYPPVGNLCRVCTKPYRIPGTDIQLDEGVSLVIPVFALHHDPELYPDPESFIPERFTDKELQKAPYYLPFGGGPRICIGQRFAMIEMKLALLRLLENYTFSLSSKTPPELPVEPKSFIMAPIGGIWLNLNARS
ncbi:unnamed protein product [Nezara viridula]|uniref:Cytochrome P450 n=1 Tax=Nezara viridula TaxID=85310 RepID=A0A9P0HGH1_NEZVI|nr:unnamed protein product [Nezara viridula]